MARLSKVVALVVCLAAVPALASFHCNAACLDPLNKCLDAPTCACLSAAFQCTVTAPGVAGVETDFSCKNIRSSACAKAQELNCQITTQDEDIVAGSKNEKFKDSLPPSCFAISDANPASPDTLVANVPSDTDPIQQAAKVIPVDPVVNPAAEVKLDLQNAQKVLPKVEIPTLAAADAKCPTFGAARIDIEAPLVRCSPAYLDQEEKFLKTELDQASKDEITRITNLYQTVGSNSFDQKNWIVRKSVVKAIAKKGQLLRKDGAKFSLDACPGPLCWDQAVCLTDAEIAEFSAKVRESIFNAWIDNDHDGYNKPGAVAPLTKLPKDNKNFGAVCSETYNNPETCPWMRGAHAKSHGCYQGVLVVAKAQSACYNRGIFADPGKQYPIHIRLSNDIGPFNSYFREPTLGNWCASDRMPNPRGVAIKVMGWGDQNKAGGAVGEFNAIVNRVSRKVDSFWPHNTVDFLFLRPATGGNQVPTDRLLFHYGRQQMSFAKRFTDETCHRLLKDIFKAVFAVPGRIQKLAARDATEMEAVLTEFDKIAPEDAFFQGVGKNGGKHNEYSVKLLHDVIENSMTNHLVEDHFAQAPFSFGKPSGAAQNFFPAKFKLTPCVAPTQAVLNSRYQEISKDPMRSQGTWFEGEIADIMDTTVKASGACMQFQVQSWNSALGNVDDDVTWDETKSPYVTVGFILVPKGQVLLRKSPEFLSQDSILGSSDLARQGSDSGTPAQKALLLPRRTYMQVCDGLVWAPWNTVDDHRPLGWTNGLRRTAYVASFQERSVRNQPAGMPQESSDSLGNPVVDRDVDSDEWSKMGKAGQTKWNQAKGQVEFNNAPIQVNNIIPLATAQKFGLCGADGKLLPTPAAVIKATSDVVANAVKAKDTLMSFAADASQARSGGIDSYDNGTPGWAWAVLVGGILAGLGLCVLGAAIVFRARANQSAVQVATLQQTRAPPTNSGYANGYTRKRSSRKSNMKASRTHISNPLA